MRDADEAERKREMKMLSARLSSLPRYSVCERERERAVHERERERERQRERERRERERQRQRERDRRRYPAVRIPSPSSSASSSTCSFERRRWYSCPSPNPHYASNPSDRYRASHTSTRGGGHYSRASYDPYHDADVVERIPRRYGGDS